ncbi:asparagine synthase (glutamine-hydrolyzing), partial [Candidatus Pelagibacter sp.]|nr:asparagine synthase (glutamine-hydrolyzing) [Candidatus Pelagibacter sp.]
MCGYFALVKKNPNFKINKKLFFESSFLIKHRGPDKEKFIEAKNILANFYRLSILDLTDNAMQPMISRNNRYILLYNGEIYNFNKLKKKYSIKANSNSDTEVLFKLLLIGKDSVIKDLEGMFSFVFFDTYSKKILFARDQFGIKPLYYYENKYFFLFSSEIKPIINFTKKKTFNPNAIYDFFFKGCLDHKDNSFFSEIKSLYPGNYGIINQNIIKLKKYWDIVDNKKKTFSEKKILTDVKKLINNSVNDHLISDRQIGLSLSGGSDSTSLAYLISKNINYKLNTFTYSFMDDEKYSEVAEVEQTIKKLNISNKNIIVSSKYVIDNFDKLITVLESPFTSIRLFGIYKIYDLLRSTNIKVMIEGDGGDEMMGGYDYNFA